MITTELHRNRCYEKHPYGEKYQAIVMLAAGVAQVRSLGRPDERDAASARRAAERRALHRACHSEGRGLSESLF